MLDEEHAPPAGFSRHQTDANVYRWGRMGEHNIAITHPAAGVYGTTSAATTASMLLASMPSIRVCVSVGIGGGIARPDEGYDIRLGDVDVGLPSGKTGDICEYDLIKAKFGDKIKCKGFLGQPPTILLEAVSNMLATHERKSQQPPGFVHQGFDNDRLFKASYDHVTGWNCQGCDATAETQRDPRDTTDPEIHYGTIASSNTVIKDAATRDQVFSDLGENCICVEMEADGLINDLPCLVIRGICDYADSQKNKKLAELLEHIPVAQLHETKRMLEVLQLVGFYLTHYLV
ncbi:nucleoside phosphorylase domain-containing protein [Aspergillus terricola var. indicus]